MPSGSPADSGPMSNPQRDPPRRVAGFNGWRVEGFDGLRACAAILVVAYHAGSIVGASSAGFLSPFVAEMKAGVTIFFVISGFLLYLPYARAIGSGLPGPEWRRFARRRAVRILPGYWVALTILAAAGAVSGVFGEEWWRYYGLAQIYDNRTLEHGLGVAWTLAVEVSFYAVLPFLACGMRRLVGARSGRGAARVQLAALAILALASLGLRAGLAGSVWLPVPGAHLALASSLPAVWDWFAAGLALAVLRAEWERGARVGRLWDALATHPAECWLLAAVVYTVGVPLQHGEVFLSDYGLATHLAVGVAAALFVLPAVAPGSPDRVSRARAFLTSRRMAWLGTISYGIYLWHVPFRDLIDSWLGVPRGALAFALLFAITLAGGICLGALSWYVVERPVQAWARARERRQDLPEGVLRPDEPLALGDVSTAVNASIPLS